MRVRLTLSRRSWKASPRKGGWGLPNGQVTWVLGSNRVVGKEVQTEVAAKRKSPVARKILTTLAVWKRLEETNVYFIL